MNNTQKEFIIRPTGKVFSLNLKEIWQYRDLVTMFIRRDIVTLYKQTILGPVWYFIQPVLTTAIFMFVFGGLAGIPTDGLPQPLFYLAGITLWNYFSETLTKTADTFIVNQHIFGKVWFPRLIVPVSITLTGLIKMGIQLLVFVAVYVFYACKGTSVSLNAFAFLFPVLLILLAGLGLGFGILISALTTKYRDLRFLITFGVQLWMYATPVIYPLSVMEGRFEKYQWFIQANPLTSIVETFRFGFLGTGSFSWAGLAYSAVFTLVICLVGVLVFNKVERSFMDVV